MKITKIKSFPIVDAADALYYVVKVETDSGIYGLGEVGIARWGAAISKAIEHLSQIVIGQDPFGTERLWQHMFRGNFFPADKVYSCAISAIDIALWDIKAKALEMPLYKLLGGPVREKVVCYPHTYGNNISELLESCKRHIDEGWKFVRWHQPETGPSQQYIDNFNKLEPVESVLVAQEQMRAIRESVGPEVQICFDVHTRLDTAHAITFCRAVEQFRPYFIEDPIRSENSASYRTLARHVPVPIAAGEQWANKWSFREVLEEELISYARIDLCIVGGLTEALKITHWAETHYIDIVPHNPLGPVSAAVCVALCMASTNVGDQEMPKRPGTYATDIFPKQIEWADGYAWCPDEPGMGVDFDEEAASSRIVDPTGWTPQLRRNDGAFTNW